MSLLILLFHFVTNAYAQCDKKSEQSIIKQEVVFQRREKVENEMERERIYNEIRFCKTAEMDYFEIERKRIKHHLVGEDEAGNIVENYTIDTDGNIPTDEDQKGTFEHYVAQNSNPIKVKSYRNNTALQIKEPKTYKASYFLGYLPVINKRSIFSSFLFENNAATAWKDTVVVDNRTYLNTYETIDNMADTKKIFFKGELLPKSPKKQTNSMTESIVSHSYFGTLVFDIKTGLISILEAEYKAEEKIQIEELPDTPTINNSYNEKIIITNRIEK